jgi:hypothetical protein
MFRILAGVSLVVALSFALAPASEVKGKITSISGQTISLTTTAAKGEKGEKKTLTAAKDVKVYQMVKKQRVEVPDGLKATELQNLGKKGVTATLIVDDDTKKVTEITLSKKKKKE